MIFFTSCNALTFDCNFGYINIKVVNEVYQCRVSVVYSGSSLRLENVIGGHIDGNSHASVEHLFLQNENLSQIPGDINRFFPNITAISWYNSNLNYLTENDLKNFPKLRFIGLWMNNLVTLDRNLFQSTPFIQYIDFDSNALQVVSSGLLDDLRYLELVDFSENLCIDFYADTPQKIEDLKWMLPTVCPSEGTRPTSTTRKTTTPSTTTKKVTPPTTTTPKLTPPTATTPKLTPPTTTTRKVTPPATTTQKLTPPTTTTRKVDTPSTTPESTRRPCYLSCSLDLHAIIPHPMDCSRYYECVKGVQYEQHCSQGKLFDAIYLECRWSEEATCADEIEC